jgi:hypothetical protein
VGTGAPSQAASVGHLAGTWSAHRVVWVWVVRERWSACSAGANLHIVINIILFVSACMCVLFYAGAPVSCKASFAWPQVRL